MKKTSYLIITAIVIVCILFFSIIIIKNAIFLKKQTDAQLTVFVQDGFSGEPLSNVRIVVAQNAREAVTDASGIAQGLRIKKEDADHSNLPQRLCDDRQDVTLLFYREGYVDTVMFDVALSEQIVVLSDVPSENWLHRLLDYFR